MTLPPDWAIFVKIIATNLLSKVAVNFYNVHFENCHFEVKTAVIAFRNLLVNLGYFSFQHLVTRLLFINLKPRMRLTVKMNPCLFDARLPAPSSSSSTVENGQFVIIYFLSFIPPTLL